MHTPWPSGLRDKHVAEVQQQLLRVPVHAKQGVVLVLDRRRIHHALLQARQPFLNRITRALLCQTCLIYRNSAIKRTLSDFNGTYNII